MNTDSASDRFSSSAEYGIVGGNTKTLLLTCLAPLPSSLLTGANINPLSSPSHPLQGERYGICVNIV